MPRCTPIALCLLTLSLATPASTRAQSADAEVMAVVRRLFDGMRRGDSAMVRSVFHPQVRLITTGVRNGEPFARVEASADGFVRAVGTPHAEIWDERISNEHVQIDGPMASVWMDYVFYRGTTRSHCGVDHFLLVRGAGGWTVIELADTRRTEGCPG